MITPQGGRARSGLAGTDLPDRRQGKLAGRPVAVEDGTAAPYLRAAARGPALAALAIVVAGLVVWNALLVNTMLTRLHMNDFGKFYYSAVAFLRGQDMYGPSPATLMQVSELESRHLWNLNPPHFHLPLLPLALLPEAQALAVWIAAGLLALAIALGLIAREIGLKLTPPRLMLGLIGVLGFAGTGAVAVTGQLSFLLLLPVTLAWLEARRGRWTNTGVLLGLGASVKPFLLVFVPYLLLRRRFRALAAAATTAAACFGIGLVVFGVEAHRSWLGALEASNDWAWAAMNGSLLGLLARALAESPYYSPVASAPGLIGPLWLAGVAIVGGFTAAAVMPRSGAGAVDRDFGLLLLGSQIISPLGWVYYLWLPAGPLAALAVSRWRESRRGVGVARASRRRYCLLLAALPGVAWPFYATTLFQPQGWATATVGSVYFWATLALWCRLIVDRFWHGRDRGCG